MLKKGIILLILGLIFSSCQGLRDLGELSGFTKLIDDMKESNMHRLARKKDGWDAISNKEYKEEVEKVITDISRRPINKRVEFEGTTLIIPENTMINRDGYLADMKTGHRVSISFSLRKTYLKISKKVNGKEYSMHFDIQDTYKANIGKLAERIIEINDFTVEEELDYYDRSGSKEEHKYIKPTVNNLIKK